MDNKEECNTCKGTKQISVAPCTTGICPDCYEEPKLSDLVKDHPIMHESMNGLENKDWNNGIKSMDAEKANPVEQSNQKEVMQWYLVCVRDDLGGWNSKGLYLNNETVQKIVDSYQAAGFEAICKLIELPY